MSVCEHGSLSRNCVICDYRNTIKELREALELIKNKVSIHSSSYALEVYQIAEKAIEES